MRSLNIVPTDSDEISINGITIENSDYNGLLAQLSGLSKRKYVIGMDQVVEEMRKYGIPEQLFPKHIYKTMSPPNENTPTGPPIVVPKRKLLQSSINTRSKTKWSKIN